MVIVLIFFFKQKTAYERRISDWSSDVCSSDLDEVARYLFRRVVSWGRSSNVFLANGARLYLDVGSHPEYATPECDDLVDLVTHDKAGERILEQLVGSAEHRLREERTSVVWGRSVSFLVALGGRRIIKKNINRSISRDPIL